MTDYLTLTEFIPGTKAKAQEVNANFTVLKDALNTKADMQGDSMLTFSVATATLNSHAVNKSLLDSTTTATNTKMNGLINRFCLKSGNITSGNADLLAYSGTTLSFKIGGSYSSALWTSANGTQETITTLANINGLSTNGTYSVIKELGVTNAIATSSKVTQGKTFPTSPSEGDYHCLITTGLSTHKFVSNTWVETHYIQLGTVTVSGGVITAVSTNSYNQNGYDVNSQSNDWAKALPVISTSTGIDKATNVDHTADVCGIILNYLSGSTSSAVTIDGVVFGWSVSNSTTYTQWQISKGSVYKATGGTLTFYPLKGAN